MWFRDLRRFDDGFLTTDVMMSVCTDTNRRINGKTASLQTTANLSLSDFFELKSPKDHKFPGPESQDAAELQAMLKVLMAEQTQKELLRKQDRQSLLEQLKFAFDLQFAIRSRS